MYLRSSMAKPSTASNLFYLSKAILGSNGCGLCSCVSNYGRFASLCGEPAFGFPTFNLAVQNWDK